MTVEEQTQGEIMDRDLEEELKQIRLNFQTMEDHLRNLSENVNTRLNHLEQKVGLGFKNVLVAINGGLIDDNLDVEVETGEGPEDSLTPSDIFLLEDPLKKTATQLIRFRIASAEEISQKTGRERAVESGYLNQLQKQQYCRKLRIGRKVFFSVGPSEELAPFKALDKRWRDLMVMVVRQSGGESETSHITIAELFKCYQQMVMAPVLTQTELQEQFEDLANEVDFLEWQVGEPMKILFYRDRWVKLGEKNRS